MRLRFLKTGVGAIAFACAAASICRGEVQWSKQVIDDNIRPGATLGVSAVAVSGKPEVFYLDALPGTGGNAVMSAQLQHGAWTTQVLLPVTSSHYLFLDAVADHSVMYLGVSSAPLISGQPNSVELLTQHSGSWRTLYQNTSGTGYGWFVSLGMVNGSIAAAYTSADSAYYSRSAVLLQQNQGSWTESSLGLPYNAGISHLSVAQARGGDPAVLVDTVGGSGAYYTQQDQGAWNLQHLPITQGSGRLMQYKSGAAFFDSSRTTGSSTAQMYWGTQDKSQGFTLQPIGTDLEVGEDAKIIAGTPTVAYFDRNDLKLHYREFHRGTWSDQIIDTGSADWPGQVSLLQVNGAPAVAYEAGQPNGSAMLVFQQMTPRPGDIDHDGAVNFADLAAMADSFGTTSATWADGDFNGDGIVDRNDLMLLEQNYQGTLSANDFSQFSPTFQAEAESVLSELPEPSGSLFVVLAAGAFVLVRLRDCNARR